MKNKFFFLLLLLSISFILRITYVVEYPEGFHKDEAALYNSYSLLKTGRDVYGAFLPPIVESLGDYRLPVSIYIPIPFVALFGLDDFWMRFPSVLFGSLTPFALYFLARKIFRWDLPAYLSALVLAISPWHILFSRSGSLVEPVILTLTVVLAVYFTISLFQQWRLNRLVFATGLWLISLFTYRTAYIFMPAMLLALTIMYRQIIPSLTKKTTLCAIFLLSLSLFYLVFSNEGNKRFQHVGLQSSGEVKLILEEQIREDGRQKPFITRLFHNKIFNLAITAERNYVSHFDLSYLFFTGDKNSSINSTPFMGHLYYIDLPFFLLGLYLFIKKRSKKNFYSLVLMWLIIGPLASAFTVDSPSAVRNLVSVVPFALMIGYGIVAFYQSLVPIRKLFWIGISCIYVASLLFFLHQFTVHKRLNRPWYRDVGVKEMVAYVNDHRDNYPKIVFADYPALFMFLLYYGKVDPSYIQKQQNHTIFTDKQKEMVSLIDSKYLVMPQGCPSRGQLGVLYVCIKDQIPRRAKIHKIIRLADTFPAFTILEFNPQFSISDPTVVPDRYSYIQTKESLEGEILPSSDSRYW